MMARLGQIESKLGIGVACNAFDVRVCSAEPFRFDDGETR